MSDLPKEVAHKILALVDESPSEPFSFERKQVEDKLVQILYQFTQQADDELDTAFNLGMDEGESQTEEKFYAKIEDLEYQVRELEDINEDLQRQIDIAFEQGLEAGLKERPIE